MPKIAQVATFSDGIHSVHATAEGLWIAHQGGVSFLDPRQGTYAKWTTAHGIPALPVLHVDSAGRRLALATPNGVAWIDDRAQLVAAAQAAPDTALWKRSLTHVRGDGAYINGVAFVDERIHAATGGGRVYLERGDRFELLELPLRQARLLRLLPLPSPPGSLRLLLVTNNSGVLLLATGGDEEPSLYQWSDDDGLASRYVTTAATCEDFVAIGVHGCVHVARRDALVEHPGTLSRWGRIGLPDQHGSSDHARIHALCTHQGALFIGTASGLYQAGLDEIAAAAGGAAVVAARIDDAPVRHLVSFADALWSVQYAGLGQVQPGARVAAHVVPGRSASVDAGGAGDPGGRMPRITSFNRRWRFVPEARWRRVHTEPECREVLALASTPEGLVLGGEAGRVVLHVGSRWINECITRVRRAADVHAVAWDAETGSSWAATRYGLFQRERRGRWMRELAFPGRAVHDLCVWNGTLLAVGSSGLHAFTQGAWRDIPIAAEHPPLFTAAAGPDGLTLVGRPGAGFFHWRSGDAAPQPLSIPIGRANCLAWGDDGALWLGSDRGIGRWDGRDLAQFDWSGERENQITALLVHRGRLYVGSHAGLWIADVERMGTQGSAGIEAHGVRLGLLDGIPNARVTRLVAHHDVVWVATMGGLAELQ